MRKILLLHILLLSVVLSGSAQVTVEARINNVEMYIGQQRTITLEVSSESGAKIEFPRYDSLQYVVPGVEYLSSSDPDTISLNEGQRQMLQKRYYITSFDSAVYYLPPATINVDGKEYETQSLALKVLTLDVDTTDVEKIYGMKPVMSLPVTWDELSRPIWLTIVAILCTLLAVYVAVRLRNNKPIIRRIRTHRRQAPHKVAMKQIEQLREDNLTTGDDTKEYYTRLTDTLRQYITERFSFNAMEMTSQEIIASLKANDDVTAIQELRDLFATADLVKFAKYTTPSNENDRNLLTVVEYINQTKQETESAPQPAEVVVIEKRSLAERILHISAIVLLSLAALAILIYVICRAYMLFS